MPYVCPIAPKGQSVRQYVCSLAMDLYEALQRTYINFDLRCQLMQNHVIESTGL